MLNDSYLTQKSWFKWFELMQAKLWKLTVLNDKGNCKNIMYLNQLLIKNNQILAIKNLVLKEQCSLYLLF